MKGKVGNAVMQTWKGVQVMRTRVIPHNPQSAAQTENRNIFRLLTQFFTPFYSAIINRFWNPSASNRLSGWNNCIRANLLNASSSTINYMELIMSQGSLPGVELVTGFYDIVTGGVEINWLDHSPAGSLPGDPALVFVVDDQTNYGFEFDDSALRSDETLNYIIPPGFTAENLFAYVTLYPQSENPGFPRIVSNSQVIQLTPFP